MNRSSDPGMPDADDGLKRLWQSQPTPVVEFAPDELRRSANRFRRRVQWRNALEYLACAAVVMVFALYLVSFPFPRMRAGSLLVILGALVVAWQLHRRGSSQATPTELGAQSWLDYRRAQWVRQRDALRSAAWWYVGPFLPGVIVFRWGVETELGPQAPFARGLAANLVIVAIFVAVILFNRFSAHRLQQQIDQLDQEDR
ncbi:hypothetical protein [Roseateles sp.]|uniref:hypothetical protein n=1 Tax=Roseateles sp. TaxID=1971397 RepID=UPI0031DD40CA